MKRVELISQFFISLVRMLATISVILLTSCAAPLPPVTPRAEARVGDPALDGHSEFLSESDFREILRLAYESLKKETPWITSIHRVHVISANEVELFVGDYDEYDLEGYHMLVEQKNGTWKVSLAASPIVRVT